MAIQPPALHLPVVHVRLLDDLRSTDEGFAGGKGANLGELTAAGLPVPPGFVVGTTAYAAFADHGGLRARLEGVFSGVDYDDDASLQATSDAARQLVLAEPVPAAVETAIRDAHAMLGDDVAVAVRSSAAGEDSAEASFAGMHESYLQIVGVEAVVVAVRHCWASLFGARAIAYRAERGLSQTRTDIAVVVQQQVASMRSGVLFTADPVTGADRVVIEGTVGLGESIVKGEVTPDRWIVDKASCQIVDRHVHTKTVAVDALESGGTTERSLVGAEASSPALDDDAVRALARLAGVIEDVYATPQDVEWALDADERMWIVQTRPITTLGAVTGGVAVHGLGASPGVASGIVRVLRAREDADRVQVGDIVVAHMTAPDWVPVMRRAGAIVTDLGGMTCHAAIVSRELGVPCVVGTSNATTALREGEEVTVDGASGDVARGRRSAPPAPAAEVATGRAPSGAPVTATLVLVNLSEPSQVARVAALEVDGVGLLRAELMVLEALQGVHPRLLLERNRGAEFVERMAEGLTAFAAGFAPRPVTYRTIDFRTNEFRGLEGGDRFEPVEANPMIGYRGAARYIREPDLFGLELEAVARVWTSGHSNLHVMLPFVRTPHEVEICRDLVDRAGLLHRPGFELWLMAEVPSILFHLPRYAELGVAGISIGSNDLTQLLLGVDRDSGDLSAVYDERDAAVTTAIAQLVTDARALGLRTSICGQAPSVHAEYPDLLVRAGIDAISVSADAAERVRRLVAAAEQRVLLRAATR